MKGCAPMFTMGCAFNLLYWKRGRETMGIIMYAWLVLVFLYGVASYPLDLFLPTIYPRNGFLAQGPSEPSVGARNIHPLYRSCVHC
jgi:hypothetical protein